MTLPELLPDNNEFREKSRRFWSKKYGRELSMGEIDEIYRNLTGYFNLLLRWKHEDDAKNEKKM